MKAIASAFLGAVGLLTGQALAATNTTLPPTEPVVLGGGAVGVLHHPATGGDKAGIAVFVMHAEEDYLTFSACTQLATRGYTVLCANNYASKTGDMTDLSFELMMADVDFGVAYLRNRTDVNQVVLFGHSGGGAMMSAYQNVAENGASACNGTEKIYPCSSAMDGLHPADGIILVDANYGLSTMTLLSVNPAIENETTGAQINESLNLYSPANGYTSNGANYSAAFTKAFQSGVAARWQRIIAHAEERNAAIDAGTGLFSDDEGLIIPDAYYIGTNNKFFAQDLRFLAHTDKAWPLLHKNESSTTQIVHSVRVPSTIPSSADSFQSGAIKTTIKRFLETFAIRVTDDFGYNATDFWGVEWNSTQTAPIGAVPGIKVPLLTMGMTGHWEYLNAEKVQCHSNTPLPF